ncbi:PilZ domain-containing protein [Magnetospirillum sp. 15-1]|uniref:PilZ domain-containing protein n=1 Tax=Magnetospirillum sp. 15-1 TaxID=1979370 RepID=UPI001F5BB392|nr:PilZ domain-containing protein [Magnetospirillum sp. 15-1]
MMTQFKERRQHVRKMGDGLAVLINGKVFPVVDISVSGVSFQGSGHRPGDSIRLTVAALRSLDDSVEALVTIKATEGGIVRGEFAPTAKLMRYIITHLGEVTGAQPAYFR